MNLGDVRREIPSVDGGRAPDDQRPRRCRVVYIHPEWRFYTVEFATELGYTFRESFFFADKRPDGPPLPEHIRRQRETEEKDIVCGRGWHSKPKAGVMHLPMYSR